MSWYGSSHGFTMSIICGIMLYESLDHFLLIHPLNLKNKENEN